MSIYATEAIEQVIQSLNPKRLLETIRYRLDTVQEADNVIKCFCPIHKEAIFRTLALNLKDKSFRCSYALCPGSKGGDLIKFWALCRGMEYDQAVADLVEQFALQVELPTASAYIGSVLDVARNYLELEEPGEAEACFRQALRASPEHLEAHQGLLAALEMAGKRQEADAQRWAYLRLAERLGRPELVRECLEKRLESEPDDDEARLRLIDAFESEGMVESLAPHRMILAEKAESLGQTDKALAQYRALEAMGSGIIDIGPHIVSLLKNAGRRGEAVAEILKRADALEAQGMPDAALERLGEALEIDPERDDIRTRAIESAAAGRLQGALLDMTLHWIDGYIEREKFADALDALEKVRGRVVEAGALDGSAGAPLIERILYVLTRQGKTAEIEAVHLERAEREARQGNLDAALESVENSLKSMPDAPGLMRRRAALLARMERIPEAMQAYLALLDALRERQDFGLALEACDEALAIQPDNLDLLESRFDALNRMGDSARALEACLALAERRLDAGQADLALERFDLALRFRPGDPELHLRRAQGAERAGRRGEALRSRLAAADLQCEAGETESAIATLDAAQKIDPASIDVLERLARCQMLTGDLGRAIRSLEDLSELLEEQREWGRCERALRQLLEIDDGHVAARERLGRALERMGRTDEAIAAFYDAARRCLAESTYSRAESNCQRILEKRPRHVGALEILIRVNDATRKEQAVQRIAMQLAAIHREADDRASERRVYETLLERWPENQEARRHYVFLLWDLQESRALEAETRRLMEALLRLRRYEEAEETIERLRSLGPREPLFAELAADLYEQWGKNERWGQAARHLADLFRRRNLLERAALWLERLIERNPEDEALRADLIGLLLRAERPEEAARQYLALAQRHLERKAPDDAKGAFRAALELDPANIAAMRALIRLGIQEGNHEDALKHIVDLATLFEHREEYGEAIATLRLAFEFDREAVPVRQKIIELLRAQESVEQAAEEIDRLRSIFEGREDWDRAIEALRQKIEWFPAQAQPRLELAELLGRVGRAAERFEAELELARFYLRGGDGAAAMAILDRLAEEEPGSIPAKRLRAEALACLGDEKNALREFLSLSAELDKAPAILASASAGERADKRPPLPLPLVDEYVFETFVIGSRNNFAYATAMAVAKSPGQAYNPLFIYSDVGLGKTHLMHAIAHHIIRHRSSMQVMYTSADVFTTELVEAIETNTVKQFRQRHQSIDCLLLDDVQFLAGKERAQEEFFHTFNTLFQAQRQIVITSDRPPREMERLERRLVSRFAAGVVVDIQPPDLETRIAILQRAIKNIADIKPPDDAIAALAERLPSNVRELKGALSQLLAMARIGGGADSEADWMRMADSVLERR